MHGHVSTTVGDDWSARFRPHGCIVITVAEVEQEWVDHVMIGSTCYMYTTTSTTKTTTTRVWLWSPLYSTLARSPKSSLRLTLEVMAAVSQLFDVLTPVAVVKGFGSYRGEDDEYQPKRRASNVFLWMGNVFVVCCHGNNSFARSLLFVPQYERQCPWSCYCFMKWRRSSCETFSSWHHGSRRSRKDIFSRSHLHNWEATFPAVWSGRNWIDALASDEGCECGLWPLWMRWVTQSSWQCCPWQHCTMCVGIDIQKQILQCSF